MHIFSDKCDKQGHAPPNVIHQPNWTTRISCPRCGKAVYETGLADHPDAAK